MLHQIAIIRLLSDDPKVLVFPVIEQQQKEESS
jgi:hypothetical protein